ncbi:MAG TPA: peptidylprolyl isomerase [Kofleriaceae bacterium]|jgi:peptidyl-prolyl cis-trans isomerase A (cyclophilin A)
MKTRFLLALVTPLSFGACHKQAEDTPKPVPNAGGDMKPEPVAKETPPAQPSPDPAPAAGQLRAPTKDDLADYTAKLPGTGSKLLAQIDTNLGTIHCELLGDKAPMTVANFVGLATGMKPWLDPKTNEVQKSKPYFDGLTFHRVISGFMIQGGDPKGDGTGGPGYTFANEIAPGLQMDPGALAMANAGPDTNGSQFFIMEGSKPGLIGGYSIFGQCKDADVVKKITSVKTDPNDRPETPVTITKVTITKG